jgi:hypothetical protein
LTACDEIGGRRVDHIQELSHRWSESKIARIGKWDESYIRSIAARHEFATGDGALEVDENVVTSRYCPFADDSLANPDDIMDCDT